MTASDNAVGSDRPAKHVFYVERMSDAERFREVLTSGTGITLTRLDREMPKADIDVVLETVHGYQIRGNWRGIPTGFFGDNQLLARCPNLLAVSTGGAGYDTVTVPDCTAAGILVVNQAGLNAQGVAEHALAMMLALSKRIGESDRWIRRSDRDPAHSNLNNNIHGKTLGIVGLGQVGERLARWCGGMFGMRVLACHPRLTPEVARARGADLVAFDALLAESDFVQVCCPLNDETRNLFDAAAFGRMKPTAYFITTGRGGIHDEEALLNALEAGEIAGAGLDVWTVEPPPADHPLLARDDVIATPHTAGVTVESFRTTMTGAAQQWMDILAGRRPPRLVNPEAWPAYRERFARIMGFPVQDV